MNEVCILIGEMGSGKNYWGEKLSRELDIPFLDGDTLATPEMVERVKKFKPLTPELIDDYVYNHLGPAVFELAEENDLILGQALYLNKHRLWLSRQLEERGHRVKFVYVKTPFLRNMKQLLTRENGKKWVLFWLFNKPFFQTPTVIHDII